MHISHTHIPFRNFNGTMCSYKQIDSSLQPIGRYLEYFTGKVFEGNGTFPYDDPEWWRQYKHHCYKFRTFMDCHVFNYAGGVRIISL